MIRAVQPRDMVETKKQLQDTKQRITEPNGRTKIQLTFENPRVTELTSGGDTVNTKAAELLRNR